MKLSLLPLCSHRSLCHSAVGACKQAKQRAKNLQRFKTQIQAALSPWAPAAEPGELSEIQHALRLAFHSLSLPRRPLLVATR